MWRRYLRFWRPDPDADLDDEFRFHFESEIAALVANGLTAEEARAEAHRRFGDVAAFRRECRRADARVARGRRWRAWRDAVAQDVRIAWRGLRHGPGFAVAAVLTIAFGVGVNTALFSLLYAAVLRPLPVRDATRVVSVHQRFGGVFSREISGSPYMLSMPELEAYRAAAHSLDGLAAYADADVSLGGAAGATVVHAQLASCDYFRVLRVRMLLGRAPAADECDAPDADPVVVLGRGLWARQFGGDSTVVGRTITLGGRAATVIGIAERGFGGAEVPPAELWVPLAQQPRLLGHRDLRHARDVSWLSVLGRLRTGRTVDDVRRELAAAARAADAEYKGRRTEVLVARASPLGGPEVASEGGPAIAGVMAIGVLVVVMACANVMNLLLARASVRRREVAVRAALGASRGRLVTQLMVESVLLASCGGAVGLFLAAWMPRAIAARLLGDALPLDLAPDLRVFGYALGVSLLTAVGFGLVPALDATSPALASPLRGERIVRGRRRSAGRARDVVVGFQVALSIVLLVTAGLFVRGLSGARTMDPGFAVDRVLAVSFTLPPRDDDGRRAASLYHELEAQIGALPDVRGVALVAALPLAVHRTSNVTLDGGDATARDVGVGSNVVSPSYFATLDVPIVAGRAFTDADVEPGRPRPAVVSAAMARRLWPSRDAVGLRFRVDGVEHVVSGIARDVHNASFDRVDDAFLYVAASRHDVPGMTMLVRTNAPPDAVAAAIRARARALDVDAALGIASFRERLDRVLAPQRATAALTGAVGLLAVTLAMVGIYGVVSYAVARRRREIGIRVAVGASPRRVTGMVLGDGARVLLVGIAAGLVVAAAAAQLFRRALLGVGTLDARVYVGTASLVLAVALAAMLVPARRATRLDPARVLRAD